MATIQIQQEMLPRMDWHAEEKAAAWEYFTTWMKLYYTVAHTAEEAKVNTILFFGGQEASDRWVTLKDQLSAEDQVKSQEVFNVFANSFKKSSSHWRARDKYQSNIKQGKQQTTAELDIYIKDLVRKCQFKQHEQEACKIYILYHATAHFEVRKPGELSYDRMIEVAKAHERTCHEYHTAQASSRRCCLKLPKSPPSNQCSCQVFSEKEALWQMWEEPQPWRLPSTWTDVPQLWQEEPLDSDV